MKTLSERIAERVQASSASTAHANRAVVVALRQEIQQALNDGWSVLAVYRTLHDEGRVAFSYQAFRRYVNQIHLGKTASAKPTHKPVSKQSIAQPSGFHFNPKPKMEELC